MGINDAKSEGRRPLPPVEGSTRSSSAGEENGREPIRDLVARARELTRAHARAPHALVPSGPAARGAATHRPNQHFKPQRRQPVAPDGSGDEAATSAQPYS